MGIHHLPNKTSPHSSLANRARPRMGISHSEPFLPGFELNSMPGRKQAANGKQRPLRPGATVRQNTDPDGLSRNQRKIVNKRIAVGLLPMAYAKLMDAMARRQVSGLPDMPRQHLQAIGNYFRFRDGAKRWRLGKMSEQAALDAIKECELVLGAIWSEAESKGYMEQVRKNEVKRIIGPKK